MKKIIQVIVALSLFQSIFAFAAGQAFNQAQLDQLLKEGKPIVVHVHAPWCPTCKAQNPIINNLIKAPEYKSISFIEVDYDTQNDFKKMYRVSSQSTIISFKGGKEVGRSTGDTKADSVTDLVKKAL